MAPRPGEKRRPHASFAHSLSRIAERIAAQPVHDLEWEERILRMRLRSRVRIDALWVAGSFARGAPTCGDLDLIVQITVLEGVQPSIPALSRIAFGRPPDVRIYQGTPEANESGASFDEAVLIWSPQSPDWNAAIDAIKVDPSAGRFARKTDEIPLRPEQFRLSGLTLEELIEQRAQGVIDWKFIPLDEIHPAREDWSDAAIKFSAHIDLFGGRKTIELVPFVIEYLHSIGSFPDWHRQLQERGSYVLGGFEVLVGRPSIDLNVLDSLSRHSILIAPQISRRGPNGLWLLTRGPRHPLVIAMTRRSAYFLECEGEPVITHETHEWGEAYSLELFTSRDEADRKASEIGASGELQCGCRTGADLLHWIATVDVVELDGARYPMNRIGRHACEYWDNECEQELIDRIPKVECDGNALAD